MKVVVLFFLMILTIPSLFAQRQGSVPIPVPQPNGDTVFIEDVFSNVDGYKMHTPAPKPIFPGDLNAYLQENINYPKDAKEQKIEGTVRLYCLINKYGVVDSPIVMTSVHKSLDKEAIRLVQQMPRWKPAVMNGSAIDISWYIDVPFKLK